MWLLEVIHEWLLLFTKAIWLVFLSGHLVDCCEKSFVEFYQLWLLLEVTCYGFWFCSNPNGCGCCFTSRYCWSPPALLLWVLNVVRWCFYRNFNPHLAFISFTSPRTWRPSCFVVVVFGQPSFFERLHSGLHRRPSKSRRPSLHLRRLRPSFLSAQGTR